MQHQQNTRSCCAPAGLGPRSDGARLDFFVSLFIKKKRKLEQKKVRQKLADLIH